MLHIRMIHTIDRHSDVLGFYSFFFVCLLSLWRGIKISGTLENLTKHNKNHRRNFSQFIFNPPSRDEGFYPETVCTQLIKSSRLRIVSIKKGHGKIIASIYYVTLLSSIDCSLVVCLSFINTKNEDYKNNQAHRTRNVFIIFTLFFLLEILVFTGFTQ